VRRDPIFRPYPASKPILAMGLHARVVNPVMCKDVTSGDSAGDATLSVVLLSAASIIKETSKVVTIVLDASEVVKIPAVDGQAKTSIQIIVGGRSVRADISTKTLRRVKNTIKESGQNGCAVLGQGKFGPDNIIEECGLVAQPMVLKTPARAA
jgi:hypothetical protein